MPHDLPGQKRLFLVAKTPLVIRSKLPPRKPSPEALEVGRRLRLAKDAKNAENADTSV